LVTSISRASARTNVALVAFDAAFSTSARKGSQADRNVIVPTELEARSGVYKKCGRGETITTDLLGEAHLRKALSAAHPEPRMTIFSSLFDEVGVDDDDEPK